ncbi:MAG: elongation factor P [Betaproteobacteria bacterium]|nr:elongation factor P [Betaproteobacteria bacterium]
MPAITTNDLKNGITLQLDNGLFTVIEFQHVKPGKGGAFVRTKLRNLKTGNVLEKTFNAGIRVEQAMLEKKDMQFLYRDGDDYVFMDTEYNQFEVEADSMGDALNYLDDGMPCEVIFYNNRAISVELPTGLVREVEYTEPAVRGDTSGKVMKPARVKPTGFEVQVPAFVEIGDKIEIDTRTGEYRNRVK